MAKVLVIDDDREFLDSVAELLHSLIEGISVRTVSSGEDGFREAAQDPPDTILLDLSMPGMDGFEVSQRLKANENTRHIPIIMLTGIGIDPDIKVKALGLGADAFLSKPCDPGELTAQIGVMLRIKEAEDALRLENIRLKSLNVELKHEIGRRRVVEEELRRHREELGVIVKERTAELNLLQEINNAVNVGKPLDDVLQMTTDGVREVLGYSVCDIYTYDRDAGEMILKALSMDSRALKMAEDLTGISSRGMRIPVEQGSFFDMVINTRQPHIETDMERVIAELTSNSVLKRFAGKVAGIFGFKSAMRAPLLAGGEVIGVIGVGRKSMIGEEERTFLGRFASQLSGAVSKAQTEEALRREYSLRKAIENSVTSGISVVSLDGEMLYVNPAFCRMVDFEPEELTGRQIPFPYWPPEEAENLRKYILRSMESGILPDGLEVRFMRRDGKLLDVIINSSFLMDEAGQTMGLLSSIVDITERKVLEKQVLMAGEEERQRIGRDLHDGIGQHLTGTAFMAKALEDRLRKKDMHESEAASLVVSNINETIDKVRKLARGVTPVEVSTDKCCALFREIADYAEDILGLQCLYHCDDAITLRDKAALGQMYMIAREAIINAAKHSGAQSVGINVNGNGAYVSLSVVDNGRGLQTAPSEKEGGGMGISIMRYRAGMIGATLEIGSTQSGGTVITCTYRRGEHQDGG